MRIADPACGTGGFLLAAYEYLSKRTTTAKAAAHLRTSVLRGCDLVPNVARLCAMNLFLHGIGTDDDSPVVSIGDSLENHPEPVDVVLTNPPFGKKSSVTIIGTDGKSHTDRLSYHRPDFWATTSNKQLNFVQHVYTMLNEGGRAAVVVPDNVLFEGGAGETIRKKLLQTCDVHTLLRLPTGIWYSPGVKANVIFFDKKPPSSVPATQEMWIYNLRSSRSYSLRQNPIQTEDLADFVECYSSDDRTKRRESDRFRRYSYDDIVRRNRTSLDVQWSHANETRVKDTPQALMAEILDDLKEAMQEFEAAQAELQR
jgi:type I restriction enzyme M protein